MALYFLDYDLRGGGEYGPLYAELDRFNAVRILESQWCFNRVNTSASGLRDHFKKFIDANDGLALAEVSDWATFGARGTPKNLG